jgi:CheY-like chemotaxis protein
MRLLAIDDDPILREFAAVYLSSPTVSVETCACGEEGLQRLRSEPFDFVLCDIDMPGMSGFDVIRELRADPKFVELPVIVITSNEDMASIDRAFEEGADSFVTKPVNWRLLSYYIRFVYRAVKAQARLAVST